MTGARPDDRPGRLEVLPVRVPGEVSGPVAALVCGNADLRDGDVVVVSQKAVSKSEGRVVLLSDVSPSPLAEGIASEYGKDPRIVELALSESRRIVRMARGTLIMETRSGIICANAGVDESNAGEGRAVLLPEDPDASARRIAEQILEISGARVAVLVSDTFGRAFRVGQTDCAIGVHGIPPVLEYAGERDADGRELRVTAVALADEVCGAAEIVMGKSLGIPAAVVRGLRMRGGGGAGLLLRPNDEDLFCGPPPDGMAGRPGRH
ncbi:MAG: coenzyme F420-0:L-glutamate ligase [Nitrosopumilus sp.]|nr:coenzyme F420-0:L-glutamate ligase [Nitrosopumilus sp.]MDA7957831.1 coenzyme F420-0:L-glutamate ligase [Nitrosopumilus sp.]